jgi:hypothetical protein
MATMRFIAQPSAEGDFLARWYVDAGRGDS